MDTNCPESLAPVCVVTGGSGFIGTHLLDSLLASGRWKKIHVLDLAPPTVDSPLIEYHHCDLRQPIDLQIDCKGGTCFHLAAICKEPGFPWDEYFLSNHVGTMHTCEFASRAGITNLIYTSTEMVFRASDKENYEDDLKSPDTAYGASKYMGELEIRRWQVEKAGRRIRIARPGVVFGRGEKGNFTRLYYALCKRRFFYIGRKTTIKSAIYVKDVVRFLTLLTDDNGRRDTYNLAYPDATSIETICHAFADTFGFSKAIPTAPYSLALAASYVFEALDRLGILKTSIHHRRIQKLYHSTHMNSDAMQEIGFSPEYHLGAALADWYEDCGHKPLF